VKKTLSPPRAARKPSGRSASDPSPKTPLAKGQKQASRPLPRSAPPRPSTPPLKAPERPATALAAPVATINLDDFAALLAALCALVEAYRERAQSRAARCLLEALEGVISVAAHYASAPTARQLVPHRTPPEASCPSVGLFASKALPPETTAARTSRAAAVDAPHLARLIAALGRLSRNYEVRRLKLAGRSAGPLPALTPTEQIERMVWRIWNLAQFYQAKPERYRLDSGYDIQGSVFSGVLALFHVDEGEVRLG
jgi:hypothetical protein